MNTYGILTLHSDASGSGQSIECENDAEAMLRAINLGPGQMQIWERDRLVGEIRGTPQEIRGQHRRGGAGTW
jgi:hypothetical protein